MPSLDHVPRTTTMEPGRNGVVNVKPKPPAMLSTTSAVNHCELPEPSLVRMRTTEGPEVLCRSILRGVAAAAFIRSTDLFIAFDPFWPESAISTESLCSEVLVYRRFRLSQRGVSVSPRTRFKSMEGISKGKYVWS